MEPISQFASSILALVRQDRPEEALPALAGFFRLVQSDAGDQILQLENRLSRWKQEKRKGLEPEQVEYQRIVQGIIEIIQEIEATPEDYQVSEEQLSALLPRVEPMPVAAPKQKWGRLILILVVCLGFVGGIQYFSYWTEESQKKQEASLQNFDVLVLPFTSLVQAGNEQMAVEKALMDRIQTLAERNRLPVTVRFQEVKQSLKNPLTEGRAQQLGEKALVDLVIWGDYEKHANWDSTLFNFRYVYLDSILEEAPFSNSGETGFLSANSLAEFNSGTLTGRIEDMVYWSLGIREVFEENFREANQLLLQITPRADRAFSTIAFNIAYAYAGSGQSDSAKIFYNKVIQLDPEYADAYNNLGVLWQQEREIDSALLNYEQAVLFAPEYPLYIRNRGIAREQLGQLELAMSDYNEAILLAPKDGISYRVRGALYMTLDSLDAARRDFDQAWELGFEDPIQHYLQGVIDSRDTPPRTASAFAHFDRAIAEDSSAQFFNGRGDFYRRLKQYEFALADVETAIQLDSNFGISYGTRAEIYAQQGNSELFYAHITHAFEKGVPVWEFIQDSAYDAYREAPAFQGLLEQYRPDSLAP